MWTSIPSSLGHVQHDFRVERIRRAISHEYRETWHPWRRKCAQVLEGTVLEIIVAIITCANFILVVVETDMSASCKKEGSDCSAPALWVATTALLMLYVFEVLARLFIYRSDFAFSAWNVFDTFIASCSLTEFTLSNTGVSLPNMQVVRIFRACRLLRTVRIFEFFPELYIMVKGIDHDGDEFCESAFSSVMLASLLLFQTLVAGDSWGTCIIPVVRAHPATSLLFGGALVTVQLGFTNLVLSVIVDAAANSREEDRALKARSDRDKEKQARDTLLAHFRNMDKDSSGNVNIEEFKRGFDRFEEVRKMFEILHVERDDLDEIFNIMDSNASGLVDSSEFADFVYKLHGGEDERVQALLLKMQSAAVLQKVHAIHDDMKNTLLGGQQPAVVMSTPADANPDVDTTEGHTNLITENSIVDPTKGYSVTAPGETQTPKGIDISTRGRLKFAGHGGATTFNDLLGALGTGNGRPSGAFDAISTASSSSSFAPSTTTRKSGRGGAEVPVIVVPTRSELEQVAGPLPENVGDHGSLRARLKHGDMSCKLIMCNDQGGFMEQARRLENIVESFQKVLGSELQHFAEGIVSTAAALDGHLARKDVDQQAPRVIPPCSPQIPPASPGRHTPCRL